MKAVKRYNATNSEYLNGVPFSRKSKLKFLSHEVAINGTSVEPHAIWRASMADINSITWPDKDGQFDGLLMEFGSGMISYGQSSTATPSEDDLAVQGDGKNYFEAPNDNICSPGNEDFVFVTVVDLQHTGKMRGIASKIDEEHNGFQNYIEGSRIRFRVQAFGFPAVDHSVNIKGADPGPLVIVSFRDASEVKGVGSQGQKLYAGDDSSPITFTASGNIDVLSPFRLMAYHEHILSGKGKLLFAGMWKKYDWFAGGMNNENGWNETVLKYFKLPA